MLAESLSVRYSDSYSVLRPLIDRDKITSLALRVLSNDAIRTEVSHFRSVPSPHAARKEALEHRYSGSCWRLSLLVLRLVYEFAPAANSHAPPPPSYSDRSQPLLKSNHICALAASHPISKPKLPTVKLTSIHGLVTSGRFFSPTRLTSPLYALQN